MNLPISHTLAIVIVTGAVSLVAFQQPKLLSRLLFWPPAIQRGQWHRFVTHGFIHGNGSHLLFNMITLFFFGRAIEQFYRPYFHGMGFVLFYLAAMVVAMLPSYWKHRNDVNYRSLGASGAVSAVLFAFILFAPWSIIYVFFFPLPAIVFAVLYTAYTFYAANRNTDNVNHSAHLWGAAFGIAVTAWIEPALVPRFIRQLLRPDFL